MQTKLFYVSKTPKLSESGMSMKLYLSDIYSLIQITSERGKLWRMHSCKPRAEYRIVWEDRIIALSGASDQGREAELVHQFPLWNPCNLLRNLV